jgi:hypothetical protein
MYGSVMKSLLPSLTETDGILLVVGLELGKKRFLNREWHGKPELTPHPLRSDRYIVATKASNVLSLVSHWAISVKNFVFLALYSDSFFSCDEKMLYFWRLCKLFPPSIS